MTDDVLRIRSRAFFEWLACSADVEKPGNLLLAIAHGFADNRVIAGPAGDPACDKAMRMRRVQQVHPDRADAQLLFPRRNLSALLWGTEQGDQRRRHEGWRNCGLDLRWSGVCIGRKKCFLQQCCEGLAILYFYKAPGKELAMIGRACGDAQYFAHLGIVRRGRDKITRLARASGFQESERGRGIIEHRRHVGAAVDLRKTRQRFPASQQRFFS